MRQWVNQSWRPVQQQVSSQNVWYSFRLFLEIQMETFRFRPRAIFRLLELARGSTNTAAARTSIKWRARSSSSTCSLTMWERKILKDFLFKSDFFQGALLISRDPENKTPLELARIHNNWPVYLILRLYETNKFDDEMKSIATYFLGKVLFSTILTVENRQNFLGVSRFRAFKNSKNRRIWKDETNRLEFNPSSNDL